MRIHITDIYNIGGTAAQCQNMVADIAKDIFHCNELGIHCYPVSTDSSEMLRARLDGILAAVGKEDMVIFQSPSWNGIGFDRALLERLNAYRKTKKIFFLHDVPPLMFESNRDFLGEHIELFNQADLLIVPSQKMAEFLAGEGLTVQKIVVQRMWDFPVSIDASVTPQFRKVMNFAGDTNRDKFSFAKGWNYDSVKLAVTAREGDWEHGANIEFLGWIQDQNILSNVIRKNGGFGLLWAEDGYWKEYMKLNANSKLSLYLAAGLPVMVPKSIPEAGTILRKNLGLAVESLDEAVEIVEGMEEGRYQQMVQNVGQFAELIRGGFFTRKALTDAVFYLLHD